jgi:hypothetical protein
MFFASFEKIILLIGIIAAVWYGFRFVSVLERVRARGREAQQQARRPNPSASRGTANARSTSTPVANVEETIRCRACGAFVPARQPLRCGRGDCPFPA